MKFSDVRQFLLRQESAKNLTSDERDKLSSFLRRTYNAAVRDIGGDQSNRSRVLLVAFTDSSVRFYDFNNDSPSVSYEGVSKAFRITVGYKTVYKEKRYPIANVSLIDLREGVLNLDSSL